jgi:hypothetical protein
MGHAVHVHRDGPENLWRMKELAASKTRTSYRVRSENQASEASELFEEDTNRDAERFCEQTDFLICDFSLPRFDAFDRIPRNIPTRAGRTPC